MTRRPLDVPTLEELNSLNSWPPNTIGHSNETVLISLLFELCKAHGFGRVPQITAGIEEIWRNPERVAYYQQQRNQRLDQLKDDKSFCDTYNALKPHLLGYMKVLQVQEVFDQLPAAQNAPYVGCLEKVEEGLGLLSDRDDQARELLDLIKDREQVVQQKEKNDPEYLDINTRCALACIEYYLE